MAFPAAPTESGAAKIHFLTTDGNAAAGWFGVTEGPTGTGANTVGFAAIATHVEGDAVAAPGGLNTTGTDVPVVLVAGDDGTNAVPLQLSGSDLKITLDSEAVVLGAGTAEIGKLAAGVAEIGNVKNAGTFAVQIVDTSFAVADGNALGEGVLMQGDDGTDRKNINVDATTGDVQVDITHTVTVDGSGVTQPVSGTVTANAGTGTLSVDLGGNNDVTIDGSSIVKAEDAAHSTGDAGIQMLAVRKATPADLSGTDGDYEPLQLDNGRLWVSATIDAALPAGSNNIGDVDVLSLPALAAGSNTIGEITIGAATGAAGDLAKAEDAVHGSGDIGVMSLAVRNDALAALAGADGDYAPFQVDAAGALYTRPHASATGGCKMFTSVDLDESEEDPTAGPTTVYGIYAWNLTSAPLWLQLFNTNTVTVGTTAPTNNFMIPANADSDGAGVVIPIPVSGLAYSTALTVAITTGSGTNNGAPGAGDAGIVILYQD